MVTFVLYDYLKQCSFGMEGREIMKDSTNRGFWQRTAKLYAPFMKGSASLYDAIYTHCLPYLTPEMEVLELACGSGQFSFRLAERVRQWRATDFSEKMVLEAQKRNGPQSLTFEVQDATNLPYPAESFDAALIANALHIMPSPDKALEEIHRVLRPGGMLLAPTFLWKTGIRQQLGTRLMELAGFRVYHKWNAQEFQSYVEARGFTALEQRTLGGGVRPLCCLIARKK